MSRSISGSIRITGEAINYIKKFIIDGEDIYEENVKFFNFKDFFNAPDDLLKQNETTMAALYHGVAAHNPESSFSWGNLCKKITNFDDFKKWVERYFGNGKCKTKEELEKTTYFCANCLTIPDKFLIKGETVFTKQKICEEELIETFFKYLKLVEKYGCAFEHEFNCGWPSKFECSFCEHNGVAYLDFDLYNDFPDIIAVELSKIFKDVEFATNVNIEDSGNYLEVYKNGELYYQDAIYDDEDEEENFDNNLNHSITFDNFYEVDKKNENTTNEYEGLTVEEHAAKLAQKWKDIRWFGENKDKLAKNTDGTFIICDNWPEVAKNDAREENEIILARKLEPSYEEVVKELGKDHLTLDEKSKAIMWLNHHNYVGKSKFIYVISKDMPILVKAYIAFNRKEDEDF